MLNKLFVFVSTLFIAFNGNGQSAFNKYFPYQKHSWAGDIVKNVDSSYTLLSQFTNSNTGGQGLVVTKFNKLGNLLLQKEHFGNDARGYYPFLKNKMYASINAYSFLIYSFYFKADNSAAFFIAKINAQTLDTVWVKYYEDPMYDLRMNNMVKLNDNCFWLIGNKGDYNNASYPPRPVIYQTDTMGNISYKKDIIGLINYGQSTVCYDSTLKQLYLAGLNYTIPQSQESYVACVDTTGSVLWNQQIGNSPNITGFYQIEKKNNYVILCGQTWVNKVGNTDRLKLSLTKLNASSGSLIWQKTYGTEALTTNLRSFVINVDESITASGSYQDYYLSTGINRNSIIIKVDSNGDSLWARRYSNYNPLVQVINSPGWVQEDFYDIQSSFDGGYIMCGVPFGTPIAQDSQAWVVKTDSLGNAPGLFVPPVTATYTALQALGSQNGLSIYPNPAIDVITLKTDFALTASGYTRLSLYNHLGQLLTEEEFNPNIGNYLTVKTSNLANGIYFLQLSGGNVNSLSKKFVVSR